MHPLAYPLAFGHWHLHSDKLTCRMPRKVVAVSAPGALLQSVLELCDGRLRWKEVAAQLAKHWRADSVQSFLSHLARQGVLVEASESLACWTDVGQLPALHSRICADEDLEHLPRLARNRLLPAAGSFGGAVPAAAAPLSELLRRRASFRTFADVPMGAEVLGSILWAAHGVAREAVEPMIGWHRTVGSGGNMHSARWFVLLLRPMPAPATAAEPLQPGLYEVRFHVKGGVSFERLAGSPADAWGLLMDPRALAFASALILPVYDVSVPARKYGNRATLFASIEAGQSLQNAQLMATALGAAASIRGDTVADAVIALVGRFFQDEGTRRPRCLAMPALLVGAKPDDSEVMLQRADRWLQLGPLAGRGTSRVSEAAAQRDGGFAFFAGPVPEGARKIYASGRSQDPRLAVVKAEAEAWERLAWATLGSCAQGRQHDLPGAMDPTSLLAYSRKQYASPGFPLKPFSRRRNYLWCRAAQIATGRSVYVPAECVHALSALPAKFRGGAYTSSSTSGIAAWTDPEGALCRATLELIERDAFLRRWLCREPAARVAIDSLPSALARRVAALEAAGHRVAVLQVGDRLVPVFSVFLQSTRRPLTAVTAAADFDAEAALAKALDEAEGRAAHAANFPALPIASARDVDSIPHIARYYQTARFFRASDFYAAGPASDRFADGRGRFCSNWSELKARLSDLRLDVLAVDITPPGAAIRQGRTPLHVTRAFVPGLLPIWFQVGMQPAGSAVFQAALGKRGRGRASRSAYIHPFT